MNDLIFGMRPHANDAKSEANSNKVIHRIIAMVYAEVLYISIAFSFKLLSSKEAMLGL